MLCLLGFECLDAFFLFIRKLARLGILMRNLPIFQKFVIFGGDKRVGLPSGSVENEIPIMVQ